MSNEVEWARFPLHDSNASSCDFFFTKHDINYLLPLIYFIQLRSLAVTEF